MASKTPDARVHAGSQGSNLGATLPLATVAEMKSGGTPSKSDPRYWGGDIPWLTPKDMSDFNGATQDCVTPLAIGNGTRIAPANCVFVAVRGMSLHNEIRVVLAPRPMSFNQDIKAIVATAVDPKFLYYALSAAKPALLSMVEPAGHGTGVLPTDKIAALPIPQFTGTRQSAIAHILGALDAKIELNRHANQTLEAMARAVFKDWFVDFGPVLAKLRGDEPYLERALWDRFPVSLGNDGQPCGWKLGQLRDVAAAATDIAEPSAVDAKTPYIGLEHMPRRSIALDSFGVAGDVSSHKSRFSKGDVLFGKLRPYFHKVGVAPLDGICSTDIIVMRPSEPHWRSYLAMCASSDELVAHADGGSTGTKMPRTSWGDIARYPVAVPDSILAQEFERIVGPMIDAIVARVHESSTLAVLRDALLPKLLSAEVQLSKAEQFLDEAVA